VWCGAPCRVGVESGTLGCRHSLAADKLLVVVCHTRAVSELKVLHGAHSAQDVLQGVVILTHPSVRCCRAVMLL
jgi:hypothetical protein